VLEALFLFSADALRGLDPLLGLKPLFRHAVA
jgi:hypothetical protein